MVDIPFKKQKFPKKTKKKLPKNFQIQTFFFLKFQNFKISPPKNLQIQNFFFHKFQNFPQQISKFKKKIKFTSNDIQQELAHSKPNLIFTL